MPAAGPLTMLMGFVLFGAVPALLKLALSSGWQASGAVVLRFLVALVLVGAVALAGKSFGAGSELEVRPVNRTGLLWRGIFGGTAVLTYFYAVQLTGAGLGTLLNYTHSIWVNVIGVLFLRHRPDKWFWPLLALAALGLWLVVDPQSGQASLLGIVVGLVSGIAGGAAVLTIKSLRRTDNALTINFALTLGGLAVSLPLEGLRIASQGPPPSALAPALLIVASAVFSFFGQLLFNHGFKHTSVALASLLSLLTPALAALSGWIFLGEALRPHGMLGGLFILISCGIMGYRETNS